VKALVTGGAGFIGSALVAALVSAGAEVSVVDDLSRGHRSNVPPGVDFHELDILDERLPALVASIAPEVVFHEAAQIDVRRSVAEPMVDTRTNVLGTVNVLEACVRAAVRRVVFASSGGAVYGDTTVLPTPETHPCRPTSAYGAAKLSGEIYGSVFQQVHGLEFVALRYANVYGPRQDPHGEAGVVAIFAERLVAGADAVVHGDGALGAYNIGTGHACAVNDLYALLARAAGVERPARHGPAQPGEQRVSCLDISRAEDLLGWRPGVTLEDGLSRTVAWFAARRSAE